MRRTMMMVALGVLVLALPQAACGPDDVYTQSIGPDFLFESENVLERPTQLELVFERNPGPDDCPQTVDLWTFINEGAVARRVVISSADPAIRAALADFTVPPGSDMTVEAWVDCSDSINLMADAIIELRDTDGMMLSTTRISFVGTVPEP